MGSRLAPPPIVPTPVVAESHFRFGCRPGNHRLLDKAAKYQPTAAGAASVKPKGELLQIGLEVSRDDRALMGAQNPTFEEACDAVHTGHRNVGGLSRRGRHGSLVQVPVLG